jgi:acetate kinase
MSVVVVNSGSSSIKYEAFEMDGLSPAAIGLLERIGAPDSRLKHRWLNASGGWEETVETRRVADHREGFSFILEVIGRARSGSKMPEIFAVGHRVVHGGEKFSQPAVIDDAVLGRIEDLIPLAPLHQYGHGKKTILNEGQPVIQYRHATDTEGSIECFQK